MKVKALEKQVSSHAKALEGARARVTATDEDLERFRQQQRRTPEGGLRQEIFRLGAAKAEAEAQVRVRVSTYLYFHASAFLFLSMRVNAAFRTVSDNIHQCRVRSTS